MLRRIRFAELRRSLVETLQRTIAHLFSLSGITDTDKPYIA